MKLGLYRYDLPLIKALPNCDDAMVRSGLIIRRYDGWGEICPLPEHSLETIDEAQEEALAYLQALNRHEKYEPTLPSVQFGVDFLAMPSMMFNEDEGYVPLTDVLDQETLVYGINIIDHAADPMAETIVVVRQLLQYFNLLMGTYDLNEIIEEKTKASN